MKFLLRRKYKFTDKKHSKKGMVSSVLFVVSLTMMIVGIYMSYVEAGNGGVIVGVLGFLAMVLSIIGFAVGLKSFKEDNVFLHFPWFGTVGCVFILVCIGCMMLIGI